MNASHDTPLNAPTNRCKTGTVTCRGLLKLAVGAGVGLALDGILDLQTVRAATREMKLSQVKEYTTSCNFCSCGCGMIASTREGKLISMEGDYDHIVNRGSLCVKGDIHVRDTRVSSSAGKASLSRAGERPLGRYVVGKRD